MTQRGQTFRNGSLDDHDSADDALAAAPGDQVVRVAVGVPVDRAFDYVTGGFGLLDRGTIVTVPFGPRQLNGIVLGPGSREHGTRITEGRDPLRPPATCV